MALSDIERRALVHAMDLQHDYKIFALDEDDVVMKDITSKVFACKITHDNFKTIHKSIELDMTENLRWGRDRIKVILTMQSSMLGLTDEIPLGVFIPTWPEGSRSLAKEVVGYDKMWLLDHNLSTNVSIQANELIIYTAQKLLRERGINEDEIDLSRAHEVSTAISTWNADDENNKYSTVINELVGMVGYGGLHMTNEGKARAVPYVPPENQPLAWLYSAGELDNIIDAEDEGNLSNNYTDIPNRWRFYNNANDQRDVPPSEGDGYFTYDNETDGPTSQQALGGTVITKTTGLDALTQTDLETQGKRIVAEDIRANETATFQTFLMPYHGHFDVINLQEHLLGAVGRFQHVSWSLDLDSGKVSHEVRRVQGGIL